MKIFALLLILLTSGGFARVTPFADFLGGQRDSLTKEDLDAIVGNLETPTISALLEQLPESFKARRLEIFASKSIQCSTAKAPRIVMFSAKGHLSCSFNSGVRADYPAEQIENRNCENFVDQTLNALECIEFDPERDKNQTFVYQFDPDLNPGPARPVAAQQSHLCMSCHGVDTRHIHEQYFTWPELFGSDDDSLYAATNSQPHARELAHYAKYQTYKSQNLRYQKLPEASDQSLEFPYSRRLNLSALNNYFDINMRRLARLFMNELYPYRYAALAAMACTHDADLVNQAALVGRVPQNNPRPEGLGLDYDRSVNIQTFIEAFPTGSFNRQAFFQVLEQNRVGYSAYLKDIVARYESHFGDLSELPNSVRSKRLLNFNDYRENPYVLADHRVFLKGGLNIAQFVQRKTTHYTTESHNFEQVLGASLIAYLLHQGDWPTSDLNSNFSPRFVFDRGRVYDFRERLAEALLHQMVQRRDPLVESLTSVFGLESVLELVRTESRSVPQRDEICALMAERSRRELF